MSRWGSSREDLERIAERRTHVAAMTRAGRPADDIAAALRITPRTVVRDRAAIGMTRPTPPQPTDAQIRRAVELLDDGCSLKEAAHTVGCSRKQLARLFPGRAWTREQIAEYTTALRQWRVQAQRIGVDA